MNLNEWELIIGLEIHVELNTRSKLFSPAPNHFGDEPNTNISDVCTGQPGTLPVLNKEAVRKAILFGCAVQAEVAAYSRFDRKSYFYPDSPRNFQITQFERPIVIGGTVTADVDGEPKTFEIDRAHLEDDAGMLKHFSHFAGVDYNRAGVPLIEVVSKPCMHSAKEAVAYAMGVKAIFEYIDASDCNMEEGSLRMDANISVRPKGEKELRNKIEIKNMNSFNFLGMAIEAEFERQVRTYLSGKTIEPATYRFDPSAKKTIQMRTKESADDYRYFLEPDLPPLILEPEYIEAIAKTLPELPYEREKRYIEEFDLAHEAAGILTREKALADYFEEGLRTTSHAKSLSNWIVVEFAGRYKESGENLWKSGIPAQHIAQLVNMIHGGKLTGRIAKEVADLMLKDPTKSPQTLVEENPVLKPFDDLEALEKIVDEVLAANAQSVEDFKAGNERALGFLVGQVMKATKGTASPQQVNELLRSKLSSS